MPAYTSYEVILRREWAAQSDPAHDIAHIRRVWTNAQRIAGPLTDWEVLTPAVVFHDLVNLPKDHPHRVQASRLSANRAEVLLMGQVPDAKLPAIRHAIEAHSFSAAIPCETYEARVLQDADRIDALGAVGVARMMMVAAQLGRPLYDQEDPGARNRHIDDGRFTLDHFPAKLLRLPETMQTEAGRALAQTRADVMRSYIRTLFDEIAAPLPDWL